MAGAEIKSVAAPGEWVVGDEAVEAIDWGGARVWGRASE
jgi:hypothetical protein